MIDIYLAYAKGIDARTEVTNWIELVLKSNLSKKVLDQSEVEHVIDYLASDSAPTRLMKMSYEQAKSNTDKWVKSLYKKGKDIQEGKDDVEMFHNFDDGSFIVKLKSDNAYQREGRLMRHCLGGMDVSSQRDIYSYRDNKNMPHATFEVNKNCDEIVQIKGKGNGAIHPRYIDPILKFLELLDQDVKPNDMKNLGYYHINKDLLSFAKEICPSNEKILMVKCEHYLYK